MAKERKINYFSLYSHGGRTSFTFFSLSLLSHNLLVHLIGVFGSARQRGREREEKGKKSAARKDRDRHKQIEPDRDKASVCHAQKKRCLLGRLWVPSHDKEQKQEGCRPDQVGAA